MNEFNILLTIGDAAGVGPEIAVRAAASWNESDASLTLCGDAAVIEEARRRFVPEAQLQVEDFGGTLRLAKGWKPGLVQGACGRVAYETVVAASRAVLRGDYDALVTAPVNKEAVNLSGQAFIGHTELVAALAGCDRYCMMQSDGPLRMVFATCHMALAQVPQALSRERIVETALLLHEACLADGLASPLLAVAGLNPHAGENGLMGREELEMVIPAIERLRALGLRVEGPFPPDTLFVERIRTRFDGIVCLYHDQGHIPFKMLAFDRGVNSTLGLPFIRTSVDHGTAFDIAWQGQADTGSLEAALALALRRLRHRQGLGRH